MGDSEMHPMVGQNNFIVVMRMQLLLLLPDCMVSNLFLGQTNSKFQKALVESGLAFQINVGYQTCKYTGPIQIIMVPNPAKIKESVKVLQSQMDLWDTDDYFTDEQLETAKSQLEISDGFGKEKTSEYIHTITYWWSSASVDYYTNYVENLKKVTRQDIGFRKVLIRSTFLGTINKSK
jgi:zinc protease